MYIHIDETGDLGMDFQNKRPSRFFVITLLVCETTEALYFVRKAAQNTLERKLNYGHKRKKNEVKGLNTTLEIKQYFHKKLSFRTDINIHSIVLDKKCLSETVDHIDQHRIYVKMCSLALETVVIKNNAGFIHLIADRCKRGIEARDFSLTLRTTLEKRLPFTAKITVEQISSTEDYALQAVDMFSYGIFCKHEFSSTDWYAMFKHQIFHEGML